MTVATSRTTQLAALLLAVCGGSLSGCSGAVDGPAGVGDLGRAVPGDKARPPGESGQALGFEPAASALRKLTVQQYQNTVRDLLGIEVELPELESDTSINGFFSIGAAKATISPAGVEKFESAAFALAEVALDASHRAKLVGCTPAGTTDATCTRDFIERFGRRAFRRPLTSEEVERYAVVAEDAQKELADFHEGLAFGVAGILQSPSFLFRIELGSGSDARKQRYDDYELATRLSYLLWNTTPDDALLESAASGALSQGDGLVDQAERLLADPRATAALDNFQSERLALEEIALVDKAPSVLPGGFSDALKHAMQEDVLATIQEYTLDPDVDFRELFTTRVAYVTPELADIYGLPSKTSGRVELPEDSERIGLLGKAALLATYAHMDETSPTKRGKFVQERLFCTGVPAPPPEVSTVLPEPNVNAATMRERLESHVAIKSCAGCHTIMDPIGLSLEHFDAVGRWRDDDEGNALDVTGKLGTQAFDGARELAALMREDTRASECVARQLYRYATGHVETSGEKPVVDKLIAEFAEGGYRFTTLVRAVITSEGFRYGAKE